MIEISAPIQETWPASMLKLLERQQGMVSELIALARTQASLITDHRTEGLLDVLARRQSLIDDFTSVQAQMAQLTHRLDERLQEALPEQRTQIKSLIDWIGENLAELMRTDEADEKSLRSSRDRIKGELGSLETARHARHAYMGSNSKNARYADRRG